MKRLEKEKQLDHVRLTMKFKDDYPFTPPFVRIVYPRFKRQTGYIIDGAFCMELLTNQVCWSVCHSLLAVKFSLGGSGDGVVVVVVVVVVGGGGGGGGVSGGVGGVGGVAVAILGCRSASCSSVLSSCGWLVGPVLGRPSLLSVSGSDTITVPGVFPSPLSLTA